MAGNSQIEGLHEGYAEAFKMIFEEERRLREEAEEELRNLKAVFLNIETLLTQLMIDINNLEKLYSKPMPIDNVN